jgi:hypothetical protein
LEFPRIANWDFWKVPWEVGPVQIYRPALWYFRPFLARHEGGRPSAQFFRKGVCRRSLHCLASSRRAKPQNEISPLYIVGSDSVATLQSDKRIFFMTLAATCTTRASSSPPPTPATPRQHMFPPGRRRTTTKHLPRPGAASPPPSLLTPSRTDV